MEPAAGAGPGRSRDRGTRGNGPPLGRPGMRSHDGSRDQSRRDTGGRSGGSRDGVPGGVSSPGAADCLPDGCGDVHRKRHSGLPFVDRDLRNAGASAPSCQRHFSTCASDGTGSAGDGKREHSEGGVRPGAVPTAAGTGPCRGPCAPPGASPAARCAAGGLGTPVSVSQARVRAAVPGAPGGRNDLRRPGARSRLRLRPGRGAGAPSQSPRACGALSSGHRGRPHPGGVPRGPDGGSPGGEACPAGARRGRFCRGRELGGALSSGYTRVLSHEFPDDNRGIGSAGARGLGSGPRGHRRPLAGRRAESRAPAVPAGIGHGG